MRRVALTLASLALLSLALPSPAHAWWEFLEELSGPGRWKGPDVDARLMCFVDRVSRQERGATNALTTAARATGVPLRSVQFPAALPAQRGTFVPSVTAAVGTWTASFDAWEKVLNEWQRLAGRAGDRAALVRQVAIDLRERAERSFAAMLDTARTLEANADGSGAPANSPARIAHDSALAAHTAAANKALADGVVALDGYESVSETMAGIADRGVALALPAPGFIYSACRLREGERRRAAIDVGMRFLWTKDDRYAAGEQINLTTIEPAFAWSLFDDTRYDVVDYGLGAGFYWISSKAFPTLKGGFLEPVRLDFHLPTDTASRSRLLRAIVFRVGFLTFPGGFDRTAFLPSNPADSNTNSRIARDWVTSYGFYLDTEFFHKKRP